MKHKPRLYELDLIRGNGKTVRVISRASAIWKSVAIRLHFEGHEINCIQRDQHFQAGNACRTMLTEWLEGKGRQPAAWETLIKALQEADLSEVASDLIDMFGEYGLREGVMVSRNIGLLWYYPSII